MSANKVDVLLVEDNADDAELTMRALRKKNPASAVVHLKNGEEALDFIFCKGPYGARDIQDIPKLILLDLKMPKVGGIEVLKKIKQDYRTKVIPTVILTSSKEEVDIMESYNLGANSYFVKPVDFKDFADTISSMSQYWLELNESPKI